MSWISSSDAYSISSCYPTLSPRVPFLENLKGLNALKYGILV